MKFFKGLSFFVYVVFTAAVVTASFVLYNLSSQLDTASYASFADTNYLVQRDEVSELKVPKDSVVLFKALDRPYRAGDFVVYTDEYDTTYLGEVVKYSDYDGLKTYDVKTNGQTRVIANLRVLGRAEAYSSFYGMLAGATASVSGRIFMCVVPAVLMVIILIVIICMAIFHRSEDNEDVFTEEDDDLFENLSRDRFIDKDFEIKKTAQKPYYNPDAHMELLKYDWLKQAVGITDDENEKAETASDAELVSDPEEVQNSESEMTESVETQPEAEETSADTEQTEDQSEIDSSVILSAEEHKDIKKSKNESLIDDMKKMLNMTDE